MVSPRGWLRRAPRAWLGVVAIYALLATSGLVYNEWVGTEGWPLQHDQEGYFAYLPPLLSGGDWSFQEYEFGDSPRTGHRVNPYSPGVALLLLPFFAAGHVLALLGGWVPDGFSLPYRLMACLGGAAYAGAGLLAVHGIVRERYSSDVATLVVLAIGLGTNLLYYATIEPVMSHAYSFALFAGVLWSGLQWRRTGHLGWGAAVGAGLGLIVLVRPTNAVFALVPLWILASSGSSSELGPALPRPTRIRSALFAVAAGVVGVSLLFMYWRAYSGFWLYNPHGGGTFYWTEPEVVSVLFSYRKGWFVYTPVMMAAPVGLALLWRSLPGLALAVCAYVAVNLYVVAAWWNWWYGGSFGMRALIETAAPLALAFAALFATAARSAVHWRTLRRVVLVLVLLNVFQSYQYVMTYIRWDGMTSASYWSVFARPYVSPSRLDEIMQSTNDQPARVPATVDPQRTR